QKKREAVEHVAKETRHSYTRALGDRFDHQVRAVADVGHCTHADGAQTDAGKESRIDARNEIGCVVRVYRLSCPEEDEIRRRVIQDTGQTARSPKKPSRVVDAKLPAVHAENLQRRLHADEDSHKQSGNLENRAKSELILVANFLVAPMERNRGERELHNLTEI